MNKKLEKVRKIEVKGMNFEGYYYDEQDNKVEVDGEFDIFGDEVRVVSVETNMASADLKGIVDVSQIENEIESKIDLDDYRSEYDHEEY